MQQFATAGKLPEKPTLHPHAKAALNEAGGNVRQATDILVARAIEDREFLQQHFHEVIRRACYDAVAACVRQERRAVWVMPQPTTEQRRRQIVSMAEGVRQTLHDFPLPGGKRLGDATREEVIEAAEFFGKQARDMAWKSRWLAHVAQSVPPGRKVADVLTPERLEELRQEVSR